MPLMACAQSDGPYLAGKHYVVLDSPSRPRDESKIEVIEIFWYGCGHCYHFEPLIKKWKEGVGADVDFWQSPAMWQPVMEVHARAFYTAEALGVLDKLHAPLFSALNVEHKKLKDQQELAAFFANYEVDTETFDKAFNSFSVKGRVRQADARARGFKITGTPELVVAGKYRISGRMAGSQAEMLKVADYLIKRERAAQKGG